MNDFKIRRGPSNALFIEPGVINPKLVIENGCWYLCTDTAELFMGIVDENGSCLRQINEDSFVDIRTELNELKNTKLLKKISNESELPTDFDATDFNPNITYYIIQNLEKALVSTYIFDPTTQSYFKTGFTGTSSWNDLVDKPFGESLEVLVLKHRLGDSCFSIKKPVIDREYLMVIDDYKVYRGRCTSFKPDKYDLLFYDNANKCVGNIVICTEDSFLTAEGYYEATNFMSKTYGTFCTIYDATQTAINQIDEKFIPKTIARTSDLLNAFYVNVSGSDNTYNADKSYAEIISAYDSGALIKCKIILDDVEYIADLVAKFNNQLLFNVVARTVTVHTTIQSDGTVVVGCTDLTDITEAELNDLKIEVE